MNKTLTVSKIVIGASLLLAGIAVFVLSCIGIALASFFDTFFILLSLFFVGFALIVTGVFMIVGNAAVLSAARKAEREAWMRRWYVPPAYGQSAPQGYARPYAPVPPQQPYAPYGAPVQGQMPPRPMPPYGAPAQALCPAGETSAFRGTRAARSEADARTARTRRTGRDRGRDKRDTRALRGVSASRVFRGEGEGSVPTANGSARL